MKIEILVPCTIEIDDSMEQAKQKRILNHLLQELAKGGSALHGGGYSYNFKKTTIKRLKELSGIVKP